MYIYIYVKSSVLNIHHKVLIFFDTELLPTVFFSWNNLKTNTITWNEKKFHEMKQRKKKKYD